VTIISNTSPISNLAAIGRLPLLEEVYHHIVIPQAVADEIAAAGHIYTQAAAVPNLDWITVQQVSDRTLVENLLTELDLGEAEAIALAIEVKAELLIIDEKLGRKVALNYGQDITGLFGVLLVAKGRGIIQTVKPMMDDLIIQAGFRVSPQLYRQVLELADE